MKYILLSLSIIYAGSFSFGQQAIREVPKVMENIFYNESGSLYVEKNGQKLAEITAPEPFTLDQMLGLPKGTETGIALNFQNTTLSGSIAYGPVDENSVFPSVLFLPKSVKLTEGKALLEIKNVFKGPNDFLKLAEKGHGLLGFRVMNQEGRIVYEGRVAFKGKGPYEVLPTIVEGPFVNDLNTAGCVLSYETSIAVKTTVSVAEKIFSDTEASRHHEIPILGLKAATEYFYSIACGENKISRKFRTAPASGSRKPFSFAFAAANRATTGGGEKDFGGTNYQATRNITALAVMQGAAFMQATGDITNGGNPTEQGHLLEYANWKRSMEPFWSGIPIYAGYGDHEVNYAVFALDSTTAKTCKIDRFPYNTSSGETTFAKAFVHPQNGPQSEDGSTLDPSPDKMDFPTYQENVYYYIYDNLAMIVLNTEYWKCHDPKVSGCPEGYIMDEQMKWLEVVINKFEKDPTIDHIIVNVHSAVFPNGDHANGAMWYEGKNEAKPKIPGKQLSTGIIERRDQLLDLCVNKSNKFLAFLSGDEHNFAFLKITDQVPLYPDNYSLPKIKLKRSFYHINNGGGGSAPYALLPTPWMKDFNYFSAPPVLAMISVDGKKVELKAMNAESMQPICQQVKLR